MKKLLVILVTVQMILAACSSNEHKHAEEQLGEEAVIHGAIREETTGLQEWPSFLHDKPEDMKIIYQAAALNAELLEKMPCYCGCGESVGHKDNYDCFVHENKEDGSVVWDDHGTKCIVCLEIAAQSINDYQDGRSVKEIRQMIDEQYKEGYAEPTPTEEV
ncbi:PCYCGC motif-containing (lipo)protein [Siminovitchia sediminis]|uniref:PCYCGC motif-containing (Lipo)protein n=1 Tax=Siminovitchia sediminis TaxID=1274353 RepID=A0ABW4KKF0_9BACI